jgi:sulfur carrier protein
MDVWINDQAQALPDGATLADALALLQPQAPYAVAVNRQFVPRTAHQQHALQPGDRVELVSPITGG